jgi:hypothetical protein
MKTSVDIEIASPKAAVWQTITDIENAATFISSIIDLHIIHQPDNGLVGLKWTETRKMFGKEASETIWITEAVENEYYCTRAENHGAVYETTLALKEMANNNTLLTMSFGGEAQSFIVKVVSAIMTFFLKGSMEKALQKDLEDIKHHIEQNT